MCSVSVWGKGWGCVVCQCGGRGGDVLCVSVGEGVGMCSVSVWGKGWGCVVCQCGGRGGDV